MRDVTKVLETDITVLFDFPERTIFNQTHNEKAFASYQSMHKHQDQRFIQHLEKENEHLRSENSKLLDLLSKK